MSRIVAGGGAETAIAKIGVESGSSFSTVGCSMSLGRSGSTRFTLSRTSWAATSPSFSSTNWMKTCEMPSDEIERNSSMPLIVLTASSILSVIWRLDVLGRGAGLARGHGDDRKIDLGKAVEPELQVAEHAEHHQHQDQHRGEDRTLDANRGQLIHWTHRVSVMDQFGMGDEHLLAGQAGADLHLSLLLFAQRDDLLAGHAVADDEHPRHFAHLLHGPERHEDAGLLLLAIPTRPWRTAPDARRRRGSATTASTTIDRVSLVTTGAMNRTLASKLRSGKLSTWNRTVWPG